VVDTYMVEEMQKLNYINPIKESGFIIIRGGK